MRRSALFTLLLVLALGLPLSAGADAAPVRPRAAVGVLKVIVKAPAGVSATVRFSGPKRFKVTKPAAGTSYATRKRLPRGKYVAKAAPIRMGAHLYQPNFTKKTIKLGAKARVLAAWKKVALRKVTNSPNESRSASLSSDGRFLAFASDDSNGKSDIYVLDNATSKLRRLTNGNGNSLNPAISGNGRVVAFESVASNLVAGDTNHRSDVFVYDLGASHVTRLTNGNGDSTDATVSSDGSKVAFTSAATNLLPVPDTNGSDDIFLWDRSLPSAAQGTQVTAGDGTSLSPQISADGSTIVFASRATNLVVGDTNKQVDIFSYSTRLRQTTAVTQGNGTSLSPSVSQNGRWVAFASSASNLVPKDTNGKFDVFRVDTSTKATRIVTANGNLDSGNPSISADGRFVAFDSLASNLAAGDTNHRSDVFLSDLVANTRREITHGNDDSAYPSLSGNGQFTAFYSFASNLVPGDRNYVGDVFLFDR